MLFQNHCGGLLSLGVGPLLSRVITPGNDKRD
jgi:hypothetical protein